MKEALNKIQVLWERTHQDFEHVIKPSIERRLRRLAAEP